LVVTGYAIGDKSGLSKAESTADGGHHWGRSRDLAQSDAVAEAFWKYVWKNPPKGKVNDKSARHGRPWKSAKVQRERRMARGSHRNIPLSK
jgi:hypothetical protein